MRRAESVPFIQQPKALRLVDADGDGQISASEFKAG